jgi:alpha-D-xyloside xylohydrolase
LGPDVQWATERAWDDLEVVVYPGADGAFTLYEDEGDSYRYEQGQYTEIPMRWNDRSRQLTIGRRTGDYPGMLATRQFRVHTPDGTVHTVTYIGKAVSVKL